ncbi:hypothetical protein ACQ4M3_03040 [Leptolyngbya sp. AN03gr2]|uniref:hypothetical protein n=1 Tax=unclassified Leptolyngbya TaxID=2650499 RepID=UPI003D317EA8
MRITLFNEMLSRNELVMSITMLVSAELQGIYNLFDQEFFEGRLPRDVYLGLRHKLSDDGLFLEEKWERSQSRKNHHELLTDENLIAKDMTNFCIEFVRQMIRVWQCEFGKTKPKKGYYNKEFATKAKELGLIPTSNDREREGSEVGHSVSLSIEQGGRFERFMKEHKKDLKLSIKPRNAAAQIPNDSKNGKRWKYVCPRCGANTSGKQGLELACIPCDNTPLQEQPYNYKK